MPVKQQNKRTTRTTTGTATNDVPQFFRLNVEVGDLESAISSTQSYLASKDVNRRVRGATSSAAP